MTATTLKRPPKAIEGAGAIAPHRRSGWRYRGFAPVAIGAGGAVVLAGISFGAGGGLGLERSALTEMATTLATATVLAALLVAVARNRLAALLPLPGAGAVAWFAVFAVLTGLSVLWSVEPQGSWLGANRLFAYLPLFALAVVLGRLFPRQRSAVLGAILLWSVVVCGYALLTKIFPAQLAPNETYARLQSPYGYWIATGLTATLGALAALWQGARRDGHALLKVAAYPALTLQLVVLLLTYSRGPLVVLIAGAALWFCYVPLRLRGAAVLITAILTAAPPVAFAFASHALSHEAVPLASRNAAGHQLGVLTVFCLLASFAIGVAFHYRAGVRPPSAEVRRRVGAALIGCVGLLVLAGVGGLAASHRGLFGTVSHDLNTLFNPNATPPANTPGRLTAVASVRARYWQQGLEVFSHHPLLGVGAEGYGIARLRYRHDTMLVRQAHSFLVQTLADLGLLGLAVAIGLFCAWLVPVRRALTAAHTEGEGQLVAARALFCIVFAFGLHSLVDWTWEVPGTACAALYAAGFLAGSARLRPGPRPIAARRGVLVPAAVAVVALGLLLAWGQWQPQRSDGAAARALDLLATDPRGALAEAKRAVGEDGLSLEARFVLSAAEAVNGNGSAARRTLAEAVQLAPSDPQTWQLLGEYDLAHGQPALALRELGAAIYLNPMAAAPPGEIAGSSELVSLRNAYLRASVAAASS